VVHTSDATLVVHRDREQSVKKLLELIEERGQAGLL
jgi:hypothetical protein